MEKMIEQLTEDDLQELWIVIGGTPHLYEYGKDELKQVLVTGECGIGQEFQGKTTVEPIGIQLDYYTMAAIVDKLRERGFATAQKADESRLSGVIVGFNGSSVLNDLMQVANVKNEDGMPVVSYVDKPNGGSMAYLRYDAVVKRLNTLIKEYYEYSDESPKDIS
jgi:hypothetical protein